MYVFVCGVGDVHLRAVPTEIRRWIGVSGARIIGGCELLQVGSVSYVSE